MTNRKLSPTQAHPIGEDLLWDYHRGALSPGQALIVKLHLRLCTDCRETLHLFSVFGSALLANAPEVSLAANALDRAMARIERTANDHSPRTAIAPEAATEPLSIDLPDFAKPVLQNLKYGRRYWAAPGVWMMPIVFSAASRGSKTYLMHVAAGMTMPAHAHRGRELTLILKGGISDDHQAYALGDVAQCFDDDIHSPAIHPDEDCLCLISQDGPIIPKTWLGRVLQPFARI